MTPGNPLVGSISWALEVCLTLCGLLSSSLQTWSALPPTGVAAIDPVLELQSARRFGNHNHPAR